MAGLLHCRFGGTQTYFGETIEKPYIGENERTITSADMRRAIAVNLRAEIAMVVTVAIAMMVVRWII